MSEAASIMRQILWHRFVIVKEEKQIPTKWKWVYDIMGVLATQLSIGYAMFPFVALEMACSLRVWMKFGFSLHIIMLLILGLNYTGMLSGLKDKGKSVMIKVE